MANDNQLSVDIVFNPAKAEAQMREFTRTAESIFAASEARKTQQTSDNVRKVKQVNGEYQDWWKRSLGEQDRFEKMLRQAQLEDRRRDLLKQLSDQKSSAAQAMQVAREGIQFEKMLRQAQLEDNRRMLQRQVADAKAAQQQIAAAHAATPQGRLEGLLGGLGVKTPQQTAQGIKDVQESLKLLADQGIRSGVVVDQLNTKMRLLETGNARGRGEFHKMTAALASLTFEITGAVYGFTALAGIIAAPAMFGTAMLKRIEDARTGVTGILLSMGTLNGKALEFSQAWEASGEYVKAVQKDSMRLGIDMGKLMEVNQAAMSGGLTAMLNLEQIQKVATAGAVAVSSLGLSSQQYVQEVRDLISGGIQPASSTLARSIGVTDALLKEWKAQGPEKLVEELTKRLQGFMVVADEVRSKTLTGAWDILQARIAMLLSNEEGFGAIKKVVMDVANFIGTVDVEGKFIFNKDMLSVVNNYWAALMSIGKALKIIADIFVFLSPVFAKVADAMRILETEFQIGVLIADQLLDRVMKLATMDFKGAFSSDKSFIAEMARLKGEVVATGRSFAGLGEEVVKVNSTSIDWKKITGNPDFANPNKAGDAGAKGHQSRMEAIEKEYQSKITADNKTLTNAEEVNVAWAKLDFEHMSRTEKLAEAQHYSGAMQQAQLLDVKEAHEKVMATLAKELEHYEKLGKKEPSQIETIQADVRVREERIKTLRDELDLREKLANAPTDVEKARTLGRIGELNLTGDLFAQVDKTKTTIPTFVRGATGGSGITEATQTREDFFARLNKQIVMGSTEYLREELLANEKVDKAAKLSVAQLVGLETRKIEEETAKIGLTRDQQYALELGKIQKEIDTSSGNDKEAFQKKLFALEKKQAAEVKDIYINSLTSGIIAGWESGNMKKSLGASFKNVFKQEVLEPQLKIAITAGVDWIKKMVLQTAAVEKNTMALETKSGTEAGAGAGAGLGSYALAAYVVYGLYRAMFNPREGRSTGAPTFEGTFSRGGNFQGGVRQGYAMEGGTLTGRETAYGSTLSNFSQTEIATTNKYITDLQRTFNSLGSAIGEVNISTMEWSASISGAIDLNKAISEAMVNQLIPALTQFQQAGETLAQTAERLTSVFTVTNDFIASLGVTSTDAFDAIGISSTTAREELIAAAGGVQNFTSMFGSFSQNILSEADRLNISFSQVGRVFAELNVSGVSTREQFAALVKAETEAGRWDNVAKLLSVSDAFSKVADSAKTTADALRGLLKEDMFRSLVDLTRAQSYASQNQYYGPSAASSALAGATGSNPLVTVSPITIGGATERARQTIADEQAANESANRAATKARVGNILDRGSNWWAGAPDLGIPVWSRDASTWPEWWANVQTVFDSLPAFANGGFHSGGLALVGERGPEIINTGPSHITSNEALRTMFDISPMIDAVNDLRAELRAIGIPIIQNTRDAAKILTRFEGDGMPEVRTITS